MYRIDRNNHHLNPKNSTIYTPKEVSQFIFNLLKDQLSPRHELIFDPCSGQGSLLAPWKKAGYRTFGNDIATEFYQQGLTNANYDFFQTKIRWVWSRAKYPKLILCNPPFNGLKPKLAPEIWLAKIIELFGKEVPLVLFTPIGLRMNLTLESKRLEKFNNGTYPPICSTITLPKNIFNGVIFHSELLIFNIKGLKPHYFYKPNAKT